MTAQSIRAVIFDLGGVVLESPLEAFREHERRAGLEPYFIAKVVMAGGEQGAWARLERGELTLEDFFVAFDAELAQAGARVSSAQLMAEMAEHTVVRPDMLGAIRKIRGRWPVAALTNNWQSRDAQYRRMTELFDEFDVVVESCKVGLRKPDPRIYQLACERLGVRPSETVFLDDLGHNLKSARALGITTIKVESPRDALHELGALLGIQLAASETQEP